MEGLVATTSVHKRDKVADWRIREIVIAYGKVRENLLLHEKGYPETEYGLSDPEHPDYGSWGGRYEIYTPRTRKWFSEPETRPIWTDTEDEVLGLDGKLYHTNKATTWRWRQAYQNDFAGRIDWTIKPYKEANHPPVAALNHPDKITAKSGEKFC